VKNFSNADFNYIAQGFIEESLGRYEPSEKKGKKVKPVITVTQVASFAKSLMENLLESVGRMKPGKNYMLKKLLPSDYWEHLCDKGRKDKRSSRKNLAGRIVSYLVDCRYLPFEKHVTPKSSGSRKYRLK
jgi:hypothetical protein